MQIIRLVFNWTALLLAPIWVLPVIALHLFETWGDDDTQEIVKGRTWIA